MNNYQRIFVAVDFSPTSDEALRQAHLRASSTGAKLAVCHVVPNEIRSNVLFPNLGTKQALNVPLQLERVTEKAVERVTELTGRSSSDFDLLVTDGTPYAAILTEAEKWLADLVIVGSHGETGTSAGLLGSVTNKVIRYAHCPVLVVRPVNPPGGIVVGTDFSDPALPAVKAAVQEAARTGAELTLVHSLDIAWTAASYPSMAFGAAPTRLSADEMRELDVAATERLLEVLTQLGVKGQPRVTQGPAGAALIDIAKESRARLLVVGTLGRTGLRRVLLGSVAETVTAGAPCSVLIVRIHPA